MFELIVLVFGAAQGALVFATAWLGLKLLRNFHWLARIAAMTLSWLLWVTLTAGGYFLAGGEGGLMDGAMMLIAVCATATLGSFAWLVGWLVVGLFRRT